MTIAVEDVGSPVALNSPVTECTLTILEIGLEFLLVFVPKRGEIIEYFAQDFAPLIQLVLKLGYSIGYVTSVNPRGLERLYKATTAPTQHLQSA